MTRTAILPTALALTAFALTGCAELQAVFAPAPPPAAFAAAVPASPAVVAPPPSPQARTAEEFDTTTPEARAAAVAAPAAAGEERLGTTVASLGSPTDPGIWLETPLVSAVAMGRVEAANGKSVTLELRPSGGAPGSGSQISLAAMRLLEVPLTGLPELTVFRLPAGSTAG